MHGHTAASPLEGQRRPRLEVADVFRAHGDSYRQSHVVAPPERAVMRALELCRTEALGGHLDKCDRCGYVDQAYNSCRNRHCPKCQALRQAKWVAERMARILPTHYFHVVFTLPAELRPLAMRNKAVIYDFIFEAGARTLLDLGQDPKRLGGQLGITAVLHTWTRDLQLHPHLHCIVTGGGLTQDGQRWLSTKQDDYLFPVKVMGRLWRGKFMAGLQRAFDKGRLNLGGSCAHLEDPAEWAYFRTCLYAKDWVVYTKSPFGGPRHVYQYLGRYTHRVAISNQRLITMDEHGVRFATKDGRSTTLAHQEFIRRFLLHVLPGGFVKIRHFGIMASGNVNSRLTAARRLLQPNRVSPGFAIVAILLLSLLTRQRPTFSPAEQLATPPADRDEADDLNRALRTCPACGQGLLRAYPLPSTLVPNPPAPIDTS